MQIENKEEYKEIPISSLGLSGRTFNALMRANLGTLYLLVEERDNLRKIRSLGHKGIDEVTAVLENIAENGVESVLEAGLREDPEEIHSLPDDILDRPAEDLHVPPRIRTSFGLEGITTIREVLSLTPMDIFHLKHMGQLSAEQLIDELELLKTYGEDYFSLPEEEPEIPIGPMYGKGFDFPVIDILIEQFGLKPGWLNSWYGVTRQSIYLTLDRRSPRRYVSWTGKQMSEKERSVLVSLIRDKKFDYSDDTVICRCLNNRRDDFACLFAYEEEIRCFFLKDLDEDLREMVTSAGFHRFTQRELSGEIDGQVIHIMKKPYFRPDHPILFRANAQIRGMTPDDYAVFLSGYPMGDSRNVTDEQITAFFDENLVNGKVYISSDPKNQWIRSLASRNGYSISDFIEFFGYESLLASTDLSTEGARARHKEALKDYVIRDNVVYFPAESHIYHILATYSYNKGINLNDYIRSLGFERTIVRPEKDVPHL